VQTARKRTDVIQHVALQYPPPNQVDQVFVHRCPWGRNVGSNGGGACCSEPSLAMGDLGLSIMTCQSYQIEIISCLPSYKG
jgi:hypothetical protein